MDDLIQEVFPPTLKFIGTDCCTALLTETGSHNVALNAVVSGVMEVNAFLKIFSALLDKVVLREEMEKKARMDESDGKMREDPSLLFRSVRLSACLSLSLAVCLSVSRSRCLSVCLPPPPLSLSSPSPRTPFGFFCTSSETIIIV